MNEATCPRCGAAFHCGANAAAPCPCGSVPMGAAALAALRQRYSGCLCLRCLADMAQCAPPASGAAPADGLGLVSQTMPMSATKSTADR